MIDRLATWCSDLLLAPSVMKAWREPSVESEPREQLIAEAAHGSLLQQWRIIQSVRDRAGALLAALFVLIGLSSSQMASGDSDLSSLDRVILAGFGVGAFLCVAALKTYSTWRFDLGSPEDIRTHFARYEKRRPGMNEHDYRFLAANIYWEMYTNNAPTLKRLHRRFVCAYWVSLLATTAWLIQAITN